MYPRVYGGFHGGGFSGGGAHIGPVGSHIGFGGYYVSPGVFSGSLDTVDSGHFLDIRTAPRSLWGVLLVFM